MEAYSSVQGKLFPLCLLAGAKRYVFTIFYLWFVP